MIVRETWQPITCRICGMLFARTTLPLIAMDVPVDICFDCYVQRLVGEVCDTLVISHHLIQVVGKAEPYALMARQFPQAYWYALTADRQRVDVLNEPFRFGDALMAGPAEGRPH